MLVSLHKCSKCFSGVTALSEVSLTIPSGRIVAIVGPNGCGKSTLIDIVSGSLPLSSGTITWYKKDSQPHGIARVSQHSHLWNNLTVQEHLLVSGDVKNTSLWHAITRSSSYTNTLSEKVDHMLEKIGLTKEKYTYARDLSFGQGRLLELGRALIMEYSLLILDEPAAGVAPHFRKRIQDIVLSLPSQGKTVLFIEHDMHFVRGLADEVVSMQEGKIKTIEVINQ